MALDKFRRGDVVEIATIDRGRGAQAYNMKPQTGVERWRGVVLMASPLRSGWWIVKKYSGNGHPGRTYTVPGTEMAHASRESLGRAQYRIPGRRVDSSNKHQTASCIRMQSATR